MTKTRRVLSAGIGATLLAFVGGGAWYAWEGSRIERELSEWRDPRYPADAIEQTLPPLGASRAQARELAESARTAAASGDWPGVDRALLEILAIADDQQAKGLLTSQLAAISARAVAMEVIAEVYAEAGTPSNELIERVAAIDQLRAIRDAVPAERALIASRWDAGLAPRGLIRAAMDESEMVRTADDAMLRHRAAVEAEPTNGWVTAVRAALRLQTRAELAELALRLRTYRAGHGAYPTDLSALGETPTDPVTGAPISYRRQGDGFVLRAEGEPADELASWAWGAPNTAHGGN